MKLKSNEFWGRRSGSVGIETNDWSGSDYFRQGQWGVGKENRGNKNIVKKYKSKRGQQIE